MLSFEEISRSISVRHIMTPMSEAITVATSATPAAAIDLLMRNGFDQAPVTDGDTIVGVVTMQKLARPRRAVRLPVEPLGPKYLTSDDTSVGTALARLLSVQIVFVVDAFGIAGFITPSDMNKHPVRTHFYLLLADLEMTIADDLRKFFDDPLKSLRGLSKERRAKVLDRYHEAQEHNVDADVLTAFELPDLLVVVRKAHLYQRYDYRSGTSWQSAAEQIARFRDHVMHPTSDMLGVWTISKLLGLESMLRGMLTAAAPTTSE